MKAYVLSRSLLHQQLTERGVPPNGKAATSVRRSCSARNGAFAKRAFGDHVITDQGCGMKWFGRLLEVVCRDSRSSQAQAEIGRSKRPSKSEISARDTGRRYVD